MPDSERAAVLDNPEDAKILNLARAAVLRAYVPHRSAAEGAAVRDVDGRTYAAATVEHADERLTTSAVRAAVAAAASSGVRRFEAVALVSERDLPSADDVRIVAEFGDDIPLLVAGPDGQLRRRIIVGEALAQPDLA